LRKRKPLKDKQSWPLDDERAVESIVGGEVETEKTGIGETIGQADAYGGRDEGWRKRYRRSSVGARKAERDERRGPAGLGYVAGRERRVRQDDEVKTASDERRYGRERRRVEAGSGGGRRRTRTRREEKVEEVVVDLVVRGRRMEEVAVVAA
jgi:hypothetical protein